MDAATYAGPIAVTALYFLFWYYLLFGLQRGTKYRLRQEYETKGKVFDRYFGQDEEMLAADRAVINTHEQMLPFIVAFWLHAIFVSTQTATIFGLAYIFLRALHPYLLGKKLSKMQSKRVYFVTMPAYLIIFYLFGSSVSTAFN